MIKYSIIIVTYNNEKTIGPLLESIDKYSADHEIIVVDNFSMDGTREYVKKAAENDKFQFMYMHKNVGFAKACNEGARLTHGEHLVFLNPDTIVTPGWLDNMQSYFNWPGIAAVGPTSNYVAGPQKYEYYTNKMIPEGADIEQLAEFAAEYFHNTGRRGVPTKLLIGFCLMIKKRVYDDVGGMSESLILGCDDLDLSWKLRQRGFVLLVAANVFVYHEGQHSFKSNPDAESLNVKSQIAMREKLIDYYQGAQNVPSSYDLWGMDWFQPPILVSIIILCYNRLEYTRKCLRSIQEYTDGPYEIIIVNNGSTDGTADYVDSIGCAVIHNSENKGVATGWNQGAAKAKGEYILVINNDTMVTPGWLKNMIRLAESDNKIGIVGPTTNYISGPQQIANCNPATENEVYNFAEKWVQDHDRQFFELYRIVGFCMLIKKYIFDIVGDFDERFDQSEYGKGNFEDDDYCLRVRKAGYKLMVAEDSFVYHFGSASQDPDTFKKLLEDNFKRFNEKHGL